MTELERAQHNVIEGRRIVAEQLIKIADLQTHGRDARVEEEDLRLFEDSLAIFEDDLVSLERDRLRR